MSFIQRPEDSRPLHRGARFMLTSQIQTVRITRGINKAVDTNFTNEINRITEQIIEKYRPEKIILFGSAARGKFGPDSDADFLIIKKDTPLYGADRIRELSRMLDRNIPLDLLVYRPEEVEQRLKLGDPFLKAVLKEGKVLYG